MKPQQKVLEATLNSIVTEGVGGLTLRDVANKAGVSLGSVSYYFTDKDGLISAAFQQFTRESADEFAAFYRGVRTLPEARRATTEMLVQSAANRSLLILSSELYALSLRRPRHRIILTSWTHQCRQVMRHYFDEETTNILDALYQGMLLHKGMRLSDYNYQAIETAVLRLTPESSFVAEGNA